MRQQRLGALPDPVDVVAVRAVRGVLGVVLLFVSGHVLGSSCAVRSIATGHEFRPLM